MIWHNPATNPAPEAHDVLIAVRGHEQAAEAFCIRGVWTYSTGHPIAADRVYAWTELPKCPVELEGGAK